LIIEFRLNNLQLQDATILSKYFADLTEKQQTQFASLGSLYSAWNDKINVISRKDTDNIYVNHVLHSLGIAKVITFKKGSSILDVGTGGGFPGIPLAILFPEVEFHLVDSIGKKITVVSEIAKEVGLTNVVAEKIRAEEIKGKQYDFVVSRAVTRMKEFYGWVQQKVKKTSVNELDNGILYLKGGDLREEMEELRRPYSLYPLTTYFEEEFFQTKQVVYVPTA